MCCSVNALVPLAVYVFSRSCGFGEVNGGGGEIRNASQYE
jgi:hypothetical protein